MTQLLVFLHMSIIVSANYLTQFPFTIFGFHTTYGAFTFPLIFLLTDLTVRFYGPEQGRRVIFGAMIPVVGISWAVSSLFLHGQFQGFATLMEPNLFTLRIAVASFVAYALGQMLDIRVFNHLRKNFAWYVAPACSMTIGNLADSVLFFGIAFWRSSNEFLAAHWFDIALFDTVFKAGISLLFLLPAYGLLVAKLRRVLEPA